MKFEITILVAEDEDNDFLLIERAFSRLPRKVSLQRVSDGVEAIDYLAGANGFDDRSRFPMPDLVLLDLKMPCKDGFEVLHWIRSQARFRSLITVVLSSSDQPVDVSRAYGLGANSYLTKPANFTELTAMVQSFTEYWLRWACRPLLGGAEPRVPPPQETVAES